MPKVKLLKGHKLDIINTNINSLKNSGLSHKHATHLALKHARISKAKVQKIRLSVTKSLPSLKFKIK